MRFIHLSDLHIGKSFSPKQYGKQQAAARKRQILNTVERVVEFANENKIDFILCAGDLLHSEEVRAEELHSLNYVISQLSSAKWISVAGNHDSLGEKSAYKKIEWCPQFYMAPAGLGQLHLPQLQTMVYTFSWDTKEIPSPILNQIAITRKEQKQILIFHGEAAAKSVYLPFSPAYLEQLPLDYIALGHIHQPRQVGPSIFYSGSLEPLDFSETGDHGFLLCSMEQEKRQVTFVPFADTKYIPVTVSLTPKDTAYTTVQKVKEQIPKAPNCFFPVTLIGESSLLFPVNEEQVRQDLLEQGIVAKIENQTVPQYQWDALKKENEGNILGEFIASFGPLEHLSPVEEKALRYGVKALLEQRGGQPW